jgi:hypothetical protein
MNKGAPFPTAAMVIKPTRENDGGLKPPKPKIEVVLIGTMLREDRVLIASFADPQKDGALAVKETMRLCLQRGWQLVVFATGNFEQWQSLQNRVSDRMPARTFWAVPLVEPAQVLGVFVGASDHRVVELRNGLCLLQRNGEDYYVVSHWAAQDDEDHDFMAMDS